MPDLSIPPAMRRRTATRAQNGTGRVGVILTMAMLLGSGLQARAMPVQPTWGDTSQVVEVYNGCGLYGHRGPYGGCRPGGQRGGYDRFSCPRGFHVGTYGHFCFRN